MSRHVEEEILPERPGEHAPPSPPATGRRRRPSRRADALRASLAGTTSSLQIPNFRRLSLSNIVATSGIWMMRVAQDWLVLQLTGSLTAVGITVALQFAPLLTLGIFGGVIVDRYSKRMLLIVAQTTISVVSALLGILVLTGAVQVWHVYFAAVALGFAAIVDNPARQVFVYEVVGPDRLRNAISVNSSVFQLGGLIGPALGGAIIVAFGPGWAFIVNAAACAITVLTLTSLNTAELTIIAPQARARGQLLEGLRFVSRTPVIRSTLVMLACISIFTLNMPVLLAAFASDVYEVGASGYGLFNTLVAAGALCGAIASMRRKSVRLRHVFVLAGLWGLLQAGAGIAMPLAFFAGLLVAMGVVNLLFITAANTLVQYSTPVELRGRVMAIYMLVLLGGQSIGSPFMGWFVEHQGAHFGIAVAGCVTGSFAVLSALALARSGRLRVRVRRARWGAAFSIMDGPNDELPPGRPAPKVR